MGDLPGWWGVGGGGREWLCDDRRRRWCWRLSGKNWIGRGIGAASRLGFRSRFGGGPTRWRWIVEGQVGLVDGTWVGGVGLVFVEADPGDGGDLGCFGAEFDERVAGGRRGWCVFEAEAGTRRSGGRGVGDKEGEGGGVGEEAEEHRQRESASVGMGARVGGHGRRPIVCAMGLRLVRMARMGRAAARVNRGSWAPEGSGGRCGRRRGVCP